METLLEILGLVQGCLVWQQQTLGMSWKPYWRSALFWWYLRACFVPSHAEFLRSFSFTFCFGPVLCTLCSNYRPRSYVVAQIRSHTFIYTEFTLTHNDRIRYGYISEFKFCFLFLWLSFFRPSTLFMHFKQEMIRNSVLWSTRRLGYFVFLTWVAIKNGG